MAPRLLARAAPAVMALYPQHVRERYGQEIVDLLLTSPNPARDLADVAWCATLEHGGTLTMPQILKAAKRVVGLIAVPLIVVIAWMAFSMAGLVIVDVWMPQEA